MPCGPRLVTNVTIHSGRVPPTRKAALTLECRERPHRQHVLETHIPTPGQGLPVLDAGCSEVGHLKPGTVEPRVHGERPSHRPTSDPATNRRASLSLLIEVGRRSSR